MRPAWLLWLAVTLPLSGYFLAGYVASQSAFVPITLSAGSTASQKLFRFGHDHLRMELEFRGKPADRPELGEYTTSSRPSDRLEFLKPGAEIILKASSDALETPILYSALPKTGHGASRIYRSLIPELSEGPGIWKWPPTNRGLVLKPGVNDIRIDVTTVAPELAGESIMVLMDPEVGFKECGSQFCWLWWWFAWPLFLLVQLIWAGVLLVRRRPSASKATASNRH